MHETVQRESIDGGFGRVHSLLRMMEERGKVRRGYFIENLGAVQFATPGADDALRAARNDDSVMSYVCLTATDPSNPYGSILPWPVTDTFRYERAGGALVVIKNGYLMGYFSRTRKRMRFSFPPDEHVGTKDLRAFLGAVHDFIQLSSSKPMTVNEIDGGPSIAHPLYSQMVNLGCDRTGDALVVGRRPPLAMPTVKF